MYSAFTSVLYDIKSLFMRQDAIGVLIAAFIIFVVIIGINANVIFLNKILNLVLEVFGIWWSIGLITVSSIDYSTADNLVICITTALLFSFSINIFFGPWMWDDEKTETSYYLILGTLLEETSTNGGIKSLAIISSIVLIIGSLIGTFIVNAFGFMTAGIIGIVIYALFGILNIINTIRYIREEWL